MAISLPHELLRRSGAIFPGFGRKTLVLRARFVAAGLRNRAAVQTLLGAPAGSELARIMAERPQMLGVLVWPYQCAAWEAPERLRRLIAHYRETGRLGAPFLFSTAEQLVLGRVGSGSTETVFVLDQPGWFMREGGLVLNLVLGNFRAFSLAFSLDEVPGVGRVATIGGLQGRNRDGVLDIYRDLTKEMEGLRPRDLLIEVFRMLCRQMGVVRIEAVADAWRHHRHPFFSGKALTQTQDYDEVWADRGGERIGETLFRLPVAPDRRDLETVKPNKRPMYRRRFALLDAIEADLAAALPGLHPEPAPVLE